MMLVGYERFCALRSSQNFRSIVAQHHEPPLSDPQLSTVITE
jgi:hypothetical protein